MKFLIKEARERKGYTQVELAKLLNIAGSTLAGYESGDHDPKSITLSKIAQICDVSVDYLLGREEPKFSQKALELAYAYDTYLSVYGKTVIDSVVAQEQRFADVIKRAACKQQDQEERIRRYLSDDAEVMETVHDSVLYARYNARREARELELEENFKRGDVQE